MWVWDGCQTPVLLGGLKVAIDHVHESQQSASNQLSSSAEPCALSLLLCGAARCRRSGFFSLVEVSRYNAALQPQDPRKDLSPQMYQYTICYISFSIVTIEPFRDGPAYGRARPIRPRSFAAKGLIRKTFCTLRMHRSRY